MVNRVKTYFQKNAKIANLIYSDNGYQLFAVYAHFASIKIAFFKSFREWL